MDEWFGLDMTDIRRMEEEVKRELDAVSLMCFIFMPVD